MGKNKRTRRANTPAGLAPFAESLKAVQELIHAFNDRGVIIGGIAVSLLAAPRFTVDLDAVLLLNVADIPEIIRAAAELGLFPRIAEAESFARKNRVLLLIHKTSEVHVDVALGFLPFEIEMVERSTLVEVGSIAIRLPTPEDLVILKAVAHRPKDLEDIRSIATSQPGLDRERIRAWVQQFGEALEVPDLWDQISRLLPPA